ncbi:putative PurR-regulated permease PerM [Friedmanniella endophytica]|uniref:Putative PurR-regulated permease PerM n=1 Tax=Microlunatus kandeliicorticis TaxID=1759536 RepID=A0A7W3IRF9_9ACTN|nr:AI-2E family transporter [Microlunatus kandeliicorticis]MBA8793884.1 putative PurR-regulated permease PerM [Microlunatus kandeliicorticis]
MPASPARGPVPVRTIAVTILMVLGAAAAVLILYQMRHVVVWLVVALFFAAALYPAVNWTQRRITFRRRLPATLIVFALVIVVVAGVITLFAVPLAQQGSAFADQVPKLIDDARTHRGPLGHLLDRLHAYTWLQQNQARIASLATGLSTPAASIVRGLALGLAGVVTVFVLALLIVLEGPLITRGGLGLIGSAERRERVQRVVADCGKTINGYIFGNLLISVICGVLTYLVLLVMGVPFSGLLALLVAITDLLPILGAFVGGVVAMAVAATHSLPAFIVVAVFIVAYQQVENHVLTPVVLSKTVKLNPLTVVIAFVAGFELAGILGALLAIPVAGIIQVVVRDLWAGRSGGPGLPPEASPSARARLWATRRRPAAPEAAVPAAPEAPGSS